MALSFKVIGVYTISVTMSVIEEKLFYYPDKNMYGKEIIIASTI
jgi:hypothetical protein